MLGTWRAVASARERSTARDRSKPLGTARESASGRERSRAVDRSKPLASARAKFGRVVTFSLAGERSPDRSKPLKTLYDGPGPDDGALAVVPTCSE